MSTTVYPGMPETCSWAPPGSSGLDESAHAATATAASADSVTRVIRAFLAREFALPTVAPAPPTRRDRLENLPRAASRHRRAAFGGPPSYCGTVAHAAA